MSAFFNRLWQQIVSLALAIYNALQAHNDPAPLPPASFDYITAMKQLITARNHTAVRHWPSEINQQQISAQIHALTPLQASTVASTLVAATSASPYALAWYAAVSFQESLWDPAAVNHNLFETNGVLSFAHTDWGFGQESGNNLPGMMPDIAKDEAAMSTRAIDPAWNIPTFAHEYEQIWDWATDQLHGENAEALIEQIHACDPQCFPTAIGEDLHVMVFWLGALAYNKGRTGSLKVIADGGFVMITKPDGTQVKVPVRHGLDCYTWLTQFEPLLTAPPHG